MLAWIKQAWEKSKWWIISIGVIALIVFFLTNGNDDKVKDLVQYFLKQKEKTHKKVRETYEKKDNKKDEKLKELRRKEKKVKKERERLEEDIESKSARDIASEFLNLGY